MVSVGPSGKKLNSSYKFRDTEEYKVELGNVVVNFARIIPDGLLVFFRLTASCGVAWRHGKRTEIQPSGIASRR